MAKPCIPPALILFLALAGCEPVPSEVELDGLGRSELDRSSHLCVGVCYGPHINLSTGKIELLSTGVGVTLY